MVNPAADVFQTVSLDIFELFLHSFKWKIREVFVLVLFTAAHCSGLDDALFYGIVDLCPVCPSQDLYFDVQFLQ